MASINYFDYDMSNSKNTVVHIGGKCGNLYLRLRARSHTIYGPHVGWSIFQIAKFEQTITHQHVLVRRECLNDGTAVAIIVCLHVLIAHRTVIHFWICRLFSVNIDV